MKMIIKCLASLLTMSLLIGACKKDAIKTDPDFPPGTMHCMSTPTTVVDVTNPITGKIWMDRNLGAAKAAESSTDIESYGDLYQWGRRADLHQCRMSATTSTPSNDDLPAHSSFILASNNYDWRSTQNDNLWQGVNGVNNPCPIGYRLPTRIELIDERTSWNALNAAGALASPLKLPLAGWRIDVSGSIISIGELGVYWTSTVISSDSYVLYLNDNSANIWNESRASGSSVRCIKD